MRSPTLASALLFVLSAAAPSPAQEKADAIAEPSTMAPRGKLLEWKSAQAKTYWYRLPKTGAAEAGTRTNVANMKQERDKAAADAAKAAAELLAPLLEELETAAPALFATAEENSPQGDK